MTYLYCFRLEVDGDINVTLQTNNFCHFLKTVASLLLQGPLELNVNADALGIEIKGSLIQTFLKGLVGLVNQMIDFWVVVLDLLDRGHKL